MFNKEKAIEKATNIFLNPDDHSLADAINYQNVDVTRTAMNAMPRGVSTYNEASWAIEMGIMCLSEEEGYAIHGANLADALDAYNRLLGE